MTAPDTDTLRALLERVEGATDDELELFKIESDLAEIDPRIDVSASRFRLPFYLRSVDEALAFHEAVLPGWALEVILDPRMKQSGAQVKEGCRSLPKSVLRRDTQVALAIIAADLKALIAKGESDHA